MKRVFKYPLPVRDEFAIAMPAGAQLLSVQAQRDQPVLWALVDDAAPPGKRHFMLRGTGHDAEGVGRFVGSFQLGNFVGHLFEAGNGEAEP